MVTQNPQGQFPTKPRVFFWDKPAPERQRSGVALSTLRQRSDDAQIVAQAYSTGSARSLVETDSRLVGRLINLACPGAFWKFLSKLSRNYFGLFLNFTTCIFSAAKPSVGYEVATICKSPMEQSQERREPIPSDICILPNSAWRKSGTAFDPL
jgi:hypothetical protein